MDVRERLARAMCARDGWENPDQTAHYHEGKEGGRWMRRWQTYLTRVDHALAAFAAAGFVVLPREPAPDQWRVAAAEADPDHPLGSYENRQTAYHMERAFQALIAQPLETLAADPD